MNNKYPVSKGQHIHLQDSQEPPSPSGETVLVLHRQGFTACYPPWGMRGVTNGGKVKNLTGYINI